MPLTLTFHKSSENKPKHDEEIVYLYKNSAGFDSYGYDLRFDKVEYCWFEYDPEGYCTGNQACYDENDDVDLLSSESENGYYWDLEVMVDGYVLDEKNVIYWMSVEDWWKSFPES